MLVIAYYFFIPSFERVKSKNGYLYKYSAAIIITKRSKKKIEFIKLILNDGSKVWVNYWFDDYILMQRKIPKTIWFYWYNSSFLSI